MTRTDTAHHDGGRGVLVGGAHANEPEASANRGARRGSGPGGSGPLARAQACVAAAGDFAGGAACVRAARLPLLSVLGGRSRPAGPARRTGGGCLGRRRREVRRRVGAAASAGARAGPRLCSVLHASGGRPAPEQQQSRASPQRLQHHQRQPPEPPPQRGRGAPRVVAAAAAACRHLPGLDQPELLRGDEPQRALDAGAVLAQALPEPRQAQSLQPDLGSALRLRHGERGPPCPAPSPVPAAPARSPDRAPGAAGRAGWG